MHYGAFDHFGFPKPILEKSLAIFNVTFQEMR